MPQTAQPKVPAVAPGARKGILHRPVTWELKELSAKERTFEGYLSTWDLDLGGDRVIRGAFKDWIKGWEASGRVVPLLDGHNYWSIRSAVGKLLKAREDSVGLLTKWRVIDGDDGDAALDRLEGGIIETMSMGYEPLDYKYEKDEEGERMTRILSKVALREGSLVIFPMNPNALIDLDSVKAMTAAAGETDPRTLQEMDRVELRRLASKIGLLLRNPDRKAGTKGEADEQDSGGDDPTDPPAPEPASTAAGDPDLSQDDPPSGEPEGTKGKRQEEEEYPYTEALQMRLQRVLGR